MANLVDRAEIALITIGEPNMKIEWQNPTGVNIYLDRWHGAGANRS